MTAPGHALLWVRVRREVERESMGKADLGVARRGFASTCRGRGKEHKRGIDAWAQARRGGTGEREIQ
jgi:hypothetical protein